MGQPNPNYPKKKMVVYEVVERKEAEKEEEAYWWFWPIMFAVFVIAPFIWLSWWKGFLDFSRIT